MVRKVFILAAVAMLLPAATAMAFHPGRCEPCHIPHMSGDSSVVPLWSGEQTDTEVFINYTSGSMDATTEDPAGSTLLCLACHDGASSHSIVPATDDDGDLSGTHPLEMPYTTRLANADGELVDPSLAGSSPINANRTISQDLLEPGTGKVKCFSCHDIHASGLHEVTVTSPGTLEFEFDIPHLVNVPGIRFALSRRGDAEDEDDYYLRYEALCTTCHEK